MYNKSVRAYKSESLESQLSVADPHRVIQLMMQGVLEKIALAKGAILRQDLEKKSHHISSAMAIINGLIDSLDPAAGKISEDLFSIYDYMKGLLLTASLKLDVASLDEVTELMLIIKSGWDQISDEDKAKGYAERSNRGGISV
ncbi:flagellar export chaperone FliS [Aeromonas salmonicida subsp. pectinolytica]